MAARQAASDTFDPWIFTWALPELVEAAVRVGDTELAHDGLARLADTTQACGTDWALGVEARCRALLSDGAAAEGLYREAIERTVEWHLRKIFTKLGIGSRRELPAALAQLGQDSHPV